MNNPKRLISPTYAGRPGQLDPSHSLSRSASEISDQAGFSPSATAPFLAWSKARSAVDEPANCEPVNAQARASVTSSIPSRGDHRDLGLWLLHDGFARQKGWARFTEKWLVAPFSRSLWPHLNSAVAKRACDLAGALVLLVLLLPVLFLVAILVRVDSPGHALFRQRRVGRDGKEFLLWKFRSMHIDAPQYAASPTSNRDPRLTRIGLLIRRVSIDELPQLVNVLRGEMSLVGPRPEMPFIVEQYTAYERRRLAVKPGITGLWQISPARALPIHKNLQYDLHYIHHQNLVLDGVILLRTIAAVIRGVGAV